MSQPTIRLNAIQLDTLPLLSPSERYRVLRYLLLDRISRSRYGKNYVLRGSTVMQHWFPDARDPNDLDLVAVYAHDPERCIREIFFACTDPTLGPELFPITRSNMLPMWEYDLFPGIRFHVPWVQNGFKETVQLDVAFDNNPALPTEMIQWQPIADLPRIPVEAWTKVSCLASKLCWIANDSAKAAPDENDLQDAHLLAVRGQIEAEVLVMMIVNILTIQKKDISVFDHWDPRIRDAMTAKNKTETPKTRNLYEAALSQINEQNRIHQTRLNTLLRDLQYPLAPLLGGLIWFPTTEEWAFLHNIAENPNDRLPALMYADWLEERTDARSQLLRMHIQQASGKALSKEQNKQRVELLKVIPSRWYRLIGLFSGDKYKT